MIPPYNEIGYLPPGIHAVTLFEIERRYAYTLIRKQLFWGFKRAARALKQAGCRTIYLDGSYITNKLNPGDYDVVWEPEGVDNTIDPILRDGTKAQIKRKYFGDIICRMLQVDHLELFQTDRAGKRKGIIKVALRQLL